MSGEHLSGEAWAQVHGKGESEGEGMCLSPGRQVSEPNGEKFKDRSQQDRLFLLRRISSEAAGA